MNWPSIPIVLMGKSAQQWQDRDYVLKQFGRTEGRAKKEYRRFVEAGSGQGRRPELVGGGLIRSAGGWSQVVSMRRQREVCLSDGRILGGGNFVEKMVEEAEERQKHLFSGSEVTVKKLMESLCRKEGVCLSELRGGSRRKIISQIRMKIARKLVWEHGVPMATVAREIGVTTSAISKIMKFTSQ